MKPLQRFMQNEDGKHRAEDRDKVGEYPRPVRADQLDATDEEELVFRTIMHQNQS
jgi:hypothetical protein